MFIKPYKASLVEKILDDEKEALVYLIINDYANKYINCDKCGRKTKLNLIKLYVCKYYKCRKKV